MRRRIVEGRNSGSKAIGVFSETGLAADFDRVISSMPSRGGSDSRRSQMIRGRFRTLSELEIRARRQADRSQLGIWASGRVDEVGDFGRELGALGFGVVGSDEPGGVVGDDGIEGGQDFGQGRRRGEGEGWRREVVEADTHLAGLDVVRGDGEIGKSDAVLVEEPQPEIANAGALVVRGIAEAGLGQGELEIWRRQVVDQQFGGFGRRTTFVPGGPAVEVTYADTVVEEVFQRAANVGR
jgi:hypothetical protein